LGTCILSKLLNDMPSDKTDSLFRIIAKHALTVLTLLICFLFLYHKNCFVHFLKSWAEKVTFDFSYFNLTMEFFSNGGIS
jgi:hypothetical protein